MTTNFTKEQQAGADAFFLFLHADAKTFVLSGEAGSGKTYLTGELAGSVMDTYRNSCKLLGETPTYTSTVFTATTNKAAEVLSQAIGQPVQTIHSYLGLVVKENYRTGKTDIQKTSNWTERYGTILFIDESSMIDTELYKIILETMKDSKIVFVGDHAQMSPVTELVSPVYTDVDTDNFVFLDKPIRNAGSQPLMDLCKQLRYTVESGQFFKIEEVPGVIDYLNDADMQLALAQVFAHDLNPSSRILAFTNQRVQQYNEHIRDIRGLSKDLGVGDVLVVAQTYNYGKISLNVEREVVVTNVGTKLGDAGYGDMFDDGLPIMLRPITIKTRHEHHRVLVPVDRWRVTHALKVLSKRKAWREFFELKNQSIDLRDKAACTVYKSQGSTYESVFIDLGNIGTSYDKNQVARMLFVAVSRPTTRIFLYGRLPGRYTGDKFVCPSQPDPL